MSLSGRFIVQRGSQKYTAIKLLRCLSACEHLVGGPKALEKSVKDIAHVILPMSTPAALDSLMEGIPLPSASSLKRCRLSMDVTLVLLARKTNLFAATRYAWLDASPAHGHDWLWLQCCVILNDNMLRVFEACVRVIVRFNEGEHGGSDILDEDILSFLSTLHKDMNLHIYTPVGLAAQHASLSHKARGVAHMIALESSTWDAFVMHFQSVLSITSDLGVEASLASFHCRLQDIKPPWFHLVPVCSDNAILNPLSADSCEIGVPAEMEPSLGAMFRQALPVAGMQHIIDNLNSETHTSMLHWGTFWDELKSLESVLSKKHRRRQLMALVRDSVWAAHLPKLEAFSLRLYEKRWHIVLKFAKAVHKILPVLVACWDEAAFQQGGDSDGFTPAAITQTLRSNLFHTYLSLIMMLDSVPEALAAWAEGCSCHESA